MTGAELDLVELLGQLAGAGWEIEPAEVAGQLCVTRQWVGKVFGRESSVSDTLAIRRDGFAEAIRRNKHGQPSWIERGSVTEVVVACQEKTAPVGHTLRAGLPFDADTARVEVFFHLRGSWECLGGGPTGLMYQFCLGAASEQWERVRLDPQEDLGLEALCCTVTPELNVQLSAWHVVNGCPDHRRGEIEIVPFDDPELLQILDRQEAQARDTDLRELAFCLTFGPCSLRDRTDPDDADRVGTALTILDHDRWETRSDGNQHIVTRPWPDGSVDLLIVTSAFRAYGIRMDSDGWVVWKQVGLVETVAKEAARLAPSGDASAPTERKYPISDDERSLVTTASRSMPDVTAS